MNNHKKQVLAIMLGVAVLGGMASKVLGMEPGKTLPLKHKITREELEKSKKTAAIVSEVDKEIELFEQEYNNLSTTKDKVNLIAHELSLRFMKSYGPPEIDAILAIEYNKNLTDEMINTTINFWTKVYQDRYKEFGKRGPKEQRILAFTHDLINRLKSLLIKEKQAQIKK